MRIDRRGFIAGVGGFTVGMAVGGVSHWLPLESPRVAPEWEAGNEQFVPSTCMLCPAHCGIRGRLMDGRLVRLTGNPLHPISAGGICAKGVAGLQLLYHPARLKGPIERTGPQGSNEFREVTWDYALDLVGTKLRKLKEESKSSSLMVLAGDTPGLMGELLERFAAAYGTAHLVHENYDDGAAEILRRCQGIDASPAFDLSSSDFVLSFGVPSAEAWSGFPQASLARIAPVERKPRWAQVDVRHSRTAAQADEWIAVRPGTYGLLALGLAYVILKEGIYDAEGVRATVTGLEDEKSSDGKAVPGFRSLVARFGRTADVAEMTGVEPESIVRLAKSFGLAKRPVALWDNVVSWRAGGLSDALAIHALNILVGALDRPGGVLVKPAAPVPTLAELAGTSLPGAPMERSPFTAANWATLVAGGSKPAPEALFTYYSNPVESHPNRERVTAALKRIPLVVSFSPFLDESARHANLVLPDCTYLERWQDAPAPPTFPIPVWGVVQPLVKPIHDTRSTGDVLLDLAGRIGGEVKDALPFSSFEEIVKAQGTSLAEVGHGGILTDELGRAEMREIEARGWWVSHGKSETDFWGALLTRGGWFDPNYDYFDRSMFSRFDDGKASLRALDESRLTALTTQTASDATSDSASSTYPLRLIPFRVMTMASGGTALMPWLLENLGMLTGDAWGTWVEINPQTARELHVSSGERVTIESESGRFDARVRVFAGAQPGCVNVPYGLHTNVGGWGTIAASNPLVAIAGRADDETGLPDWYSTRVRIVGA